MTVKVGVIGLGMGRHHARRYHESEQAELAAICDLNHSLLAEYQALYPRARPYLHYEDLLAAGEVEAVSVALPNHLHAPVSIAALGAGVHVLCEKPMALNAAQAAEMLATARASGSKLMIHFNYRYGPHAQWLKAYVDEGRLGQVYYAKTHWLRARGIPKLGGWFGIKALSGGGPLIDLGVHRLDLAMWLMGYPRAVSVSAATHSLLGARLAREQAAAYDVEDLASALVRVENDATLNLEVSWAGGTDRSEDMLTAIYGTEGAAIHRNIGDGYEMEALALTDAGGALSAVSPRVLPRGCPSAIDRFLECIIEDTAPEASGEQGLEMMRLIDAIYLSAAEGREVRLDG